MMILLLDLNPSFYALQVRGKATELREQSGFLKFYPRTKQLTSSQINF